MHWIRPVSTVTLVLVLTPALHTQQPTSAQTYLQAALASLNSASIQGMSLWGNSTANAGDVTENGSFTAQCATNGASQLQPGLSNGPTSINRQTSNGTPSGTWTDTEGQAHPIAGHNLMTPAAWFCPQVAIVSILQNQSLSLRLAGTQSRNGESVVHIAVTASVRDTSPASTLNQHLSQFDIYLDSASYRPVEFDFNVHPDNNALIDIPVQIHFSNYVQSGGVWAPGTIERFANSTLELTLQVVSATPISVTAQN